MPKFNKTVNSRLFSAFTRENQRPSDLAQFLATRNQEILNKNDNRRTKE